MKKIWEKWKQIAESIGNVQTAIIFSALYFVIVFPLSLIVKLDRYSKPKKEISWRKIEDCFTSIDKLKKL